jgi:hypothetical protein
MPTILEVYNYETSTTLSREFLICDYCFWAASSISSRRRDINTCPRCDEVISRIPLTVGEKATFSIDPKRGVELAFDGR